MTKALVLAGGGTRGSYQNGAIHALRRLGKDDWDLVTGTSIGALNAAFVVQKDYRKMDRLWHTLTQDHVVNGALSVDMDFNDIVNERSQVVPFLRDFIRDRGADITPLKRYISEMWDKEKFFASDIDFGCVVCRYRNREPVFVDKEMMREHGIDWLISTASAYPAFPVYHFEEGDFIDGGYYDNLPIDYALRKGADEIIAIDLRSEPQHPNYFNRSGITYIFPHHETKSFLSFDRSTMDRLETLGYYDTMKTFGMFDGFRYTFEKTELPSWFAGFMREILMLEWRIHDSTQIANRLLSSQAVTDRIASQQKTKTVNERQMFFGFMDSLMSACGLSDVKVWSYRSARDAILAGFAECAEDTYEYLPESFRTEKLLSYASTLGTKGIVEKMVHTELYPSHAFIPESVWLTVYPYERALAMFVGKLLEELKGE
ncbi:MAG: patatin-like phospholipase family protein [Solobacterium sp.]|nr:patatin-like phospholipase family protein [Solobacterium sp.]